MKNKSICCIGAGYVGGPTMAVIALKCPDIKVTVVDKNKDKIDKWNSEDLNMLPVFEPGLKEIIEKVRNVNLFFKHDVEKAIEDNDIIFMAVNTPTKKYGEGKGMAADLTYVENCSRLISKHSKSDKIVVEKSTLPVRTAEKIKEILSANSSFNFEVVSNPEFLAEGTAIEDLFKSDRVLIGGNDTENGKRAVQKIVSIYSHWIPNDKIITTNLWSSELTKLVSNAFLAQRISSINSISSLCEETGADIEEVSKSVGMDSRIGNKFLNASIGFGGSCFKKDILNLVYLFMHYGLDKEASYWQSVVDINTHQTTRIGKKIIQSLNSNVNNKTITIYGWSFKKNTNDSRESASIYLARQLLNDMAYINVYDPMVSEKRIKRDLEEIFEDDNLNDIKSLIRRVKVFKEYDKAAEMSDAIIISTEWDEFKSFDWNHIYDLMKKPAWIFDGRNLLDSIALEKLGFEIYSIGKSAS